MSAFSNYLETQIVNWINGSAFASSTTLTGGTWVQLYTQDPTEAGSPTGAVYNRFNVPANGWTVGTNGATPPATTISNTAQILITNNATQAALVTHVAVFTASTGGEMLFYGALGTQKQVALTDEVRFNIGALTLAVN
jgi:hypothetical protein